MLACMAANSAAVEGLSPEVVGRADKGGAPEAAAALQVGGRWGGTAPAVVKRGEAPAICHGIGNAGAAPAGTEGAADTTGARADASAAAGPAGCASSAPENILKLSSDWGKPAAPPRRAEFMLNIDPAVLKQALVVDQGVRCNDVAAPSRFRAALHRKLCGWKLCGLTSRATTSPHA